MEAAPAGWVLDTDALYVHESGVRIERRVYRNKEGWFLVPVDLDHQVIGFAPDREGLEKAFAAFAKASARPDSTKPAEESEEDSEDASDDNAEDQGDD